MIIGRPLSRHRVIGLRLDAIRHRLASFTPLRTADLLALSARRSNQLSYTVVVRVLTCVHDVMNRKDDACHDTACRFHMKLWRPLGCNTVSPRIVRFAYFLKSAHLAACLYATVA